MGGWILHPHIGPAKKQPAGALNSLLPSFQCLSTGNLLQHSEEMAVVTHPVRGLDQGLRSGGRLHHLQLLSFSPRVFIVFTIPSSKVAQNDLFTNAY